MRTRPGRRGLLLATLTREVFGGKATQPVLCSLGCDRQPARKQGYQASGCGLGVFQMLCPRSSYLVLNHIQKRLWGLSSLGSALIPEPLLPTPGWPPATTRSAHPAPLKRAIALRCHRINLQGLVAWEVRRRQSLSPSPGSRAQAEWVLFPTPGHSP